MMVVIRVMLLSIDTLSIYYGIGFVAGARSAVAVTKPVLLQVRAASKISFVTPFHRIAASIM